ncbi:LysR family transcriptional regulator [Falsihalocynthiibacter sp. SS001]|uniref:LysR family transcriptional regulator n=1 Tax=Falsihalocynthiibacter sp. SS001 TaxID=3349698 RepID=UPI0036D23650
MQALLNRIQLRHLRLIHTIGEVGQLSIAAQRLAITQPAASRMLSELEKMVGQPLFIRNPKGMVPTPIAEVLIRHAGRLLQGLSATVNEVSAFGAGKTGTVRVGSVTGAAVAYIVPAIQALERDAQGADIHVDVGPSDQLMTGLLQGDYDFILSRIPEDQDAREFEVMRGRVELVEFMVRAGHPLLDISKPQLAGLEGYGWVVQSPGAPMREAIEEAYLTRGIPLPQEIINTTSLLFMISYLQESDFISPISSEVAKLLRDTGAGGMQTVRTEQSVIISPYHLLQRKDFVSSPLSDHLRDRIVQALANTASVS